MTNFEHTIVNRKKSARPNRTPFSSLIGEELQGLHIRLLLAQIILAPLPLHVGSRLRTFLLRLAGFRIGPGTVMWGTPTITGGDDLYRRLIIGQECWFNAGCFLDLGATITIGDRIAFGQQVLLMTSSHTLADPLRRSGPLTTKPITIHDGAWVGARAIILPGVTIGQGAVVAAGAVVTKNVAPHTLVAGVPAKVIRQLGEEYEPTTI